MHPFNKPLKELGLTDIQSLINNGVSESRTLDYKRDLYGGNDKETKEFLRDVSALANTVGGYLIIGVHEEEKIPQAMTPVAIENIDKLELRFQDLLRMSVDPPIRGVEFQPIDAGNGKYVLVIAIPRSVSRPHAISHKKHWRFYGRNSAGNYPYEVSDVRQTILQSETLAAKIRNFRSDRLSQISVGETPVPMSGGAKTVLHLIPSSSLDLPVQHDIVRMSSIDMWPVHVGTCNHRVNLDGIVTYQAGGDEGHAFCYTQLFRNGIVEAVDTYFDARGKLIPSKGYEENLVAVLSKYRSALDTLGVGFPQWVCLSLLGVRDYQMGTSTASLRGVHLVDRDELILPEIQIEDANDPAERVLKPAFDCIWNACGYERSMNYDENGNWIAKGY